MAMQNAIPVVTWTQAQVGNWNSTSAVQDPPSQVVDLTMETLHKEAWMEDGSMELYDNKDVSGIMTCSTKTATGDADKEAGFVVAIYMFGIEVEKKTKRSYYCKTPDPMICGWNSSNWL